MSKRGSVIAMPAWRGLAPWTTLVVLIALSLWLPNRVTGMPQASQRQAAIATALASAPYIVGAWVGADAPVPREAQQLLRPNAILSRSYRRTGGERVHLLVVHCADARDMIGHYPPICYPSSGWVAEESATADVAMSLAGKRLPMRGYVFRRIGEGGGEESIRVLNAFVLPGGVVAREMGEIHRQSQRRALAAQGVAQIQVVCSAGWDPAGVAAAAGELLGGMPRVRQALGLGRGASDAQE